MNLLMLASTTAAFLLAASVFPASGATPHVGTGPSFKGPIGLQLYSLRAEFTRNVPSTLEKVRAMGIHEVELAGTYNLSPERFASMLREFGLDPVSGHFPYERLKSDPEGVAREAKTLGLQYAGCAWIPHQAEFNEADCRDAIATFNRVGQACRKQGVRFFYHVHGYEFRPHGKGTLLDMLITETKPEWVTYEMDVLWVVFPGQDPVALLHKHAKRWELMHLKDLRKGVKGNQSGGGDVTNDVVLGTGQMNWPAILKAAREVGVKHYFIEDESPTAEQQVPQSLRYLETVRW